MKPNLPHPSQTARRWRDFLLASVLALTSACSAQPKEVEGKRRLAIMTALPVFLGEGGATAVLNGEDQRAPIVKHLEAQWKLTPLGKLDGPGLSRADLLVLAQPRGLAPEELVALDKWVRAGGRVAIFADPLLVWPSTLALGDRRRPPPVTLLDPLIAHWGLELAGAPGEEEAAFDMAGMPAIGAGVGRWEARGGSCTVSKDARAASCRIGKGRAELVADADVLDLQNSPDNASAIDALLGQLVL